MANNNTDQMRRLFNQVILAGPIAEIEDFTEAKTKDGVDYVSFRGIIRCGDTPVYDTRFRIFSTASRKDPSTGKIVDRPNFVKLRDWCRNCVPLTKSTEDATWAELGGFVAMNDYVNNKGMLVQGVQFNINWTNPFTDYKGEINIEGMLQSIQDEVRKSNKEDEDGEPTGRKALRIISSDIYGNAVDLRILKATAEIGQLLEDNDYGSGSLATYFITLTPTENQEAEVKKGGIGKQRTTTQARAYLEYMVEGADPIIEEEDEKNYIPPSVFKNLMSERKSKLKEIEENGYQGGNNGGSSAGASSGTKAKAGIGKTNSSAKNKPNVLDEVDDDNMPF